MVALVVLANYLLPAAGSMCTSTLLSTSVLIPHMRVSPSTGMINALRPGAVRNWTKTGGRALHDGGKVRVQACSGSGRPRVAWLIQVDRAGQGACIFPERQWES